MNRVRETLTGWAEGVTPSYELLDTGVHTVHHRLARRWRVGRVFLAGDAAHLLGALGTQGLEEGLRDADNLAWKLALAWHHGPREALLDSYQEERRSVIAARLRAADQVLPLLRGGGGLRSYVPGSSRGHDALLADGHLGRGALGAPGAYADSPLTAGALAGETAVGTPPGSPVADVRVTAEDGTFVRLRDRLGRGSLLVVLIAPGTGVWDRKHWVTAGIMPRLAAAVTALPHRAELLVAEAYPVPPPIPCCWCGPTATWSRRSAACGRPTCTRRLRRPSAGRRRTRPTHPATRTRRRERRPDPLTGRPAVRLRGPWTTAASVATRRGRNPPSAW